MTTKLFFNIIYRECFSKWILEYPEQCPSLVGYYTKLRIYLKNVEVFYYDFPEKGVRIRQFLALQQDLDSDWNKFVRDIIDPQKWNYRQVFENKHLLEQQISLIESSESLFEKKDNESYLGIIQRRKKFLLYAEHLANILHKEELENEQSSEIEELKVHRKFWEHLENQFNLIFPEAIDLAIKTKEINQRINQQIKKKRGLAQIDKDFVQSEETLRIEQQTVDLVEGNQPDSIHESLLEKDIKEIEEEKQRIQVD